MLYLAIPAHNEAATIGVLLWRLRTVLAEFPREYEAVVYDDASTDSTSEILESYAKVMPLTVLRGDRQVGYAGAVDALVRHVARDTRYPRRDAMLLLQGDFTDSPSLVPEFVKRFEGGTDIVVGERERAVRRKAPAPVKRLLQLEPWLTRFLVRAEGIRDLTSSYRLVRISVLRDLLRTVGDAPVCAGDSRTANADFLMRIVPLARRVEALPVEPTWDVRLRETRVVAVPDAMSLLRWAWRSRGRKAVPSTAPETAEAPRHARTAREGRADLRLEGRSDSSADVAVAIESGRNSGTRDTAGRNRKPRNGRSESKTDSRSEVRTESRGEPRSQARNGSRSEKSIEPRLEGRENDFKADPRREARPVTRHEIPAEEGAVVEATLDSEAPVRERPPRRKRSRGGRRDRTENASDLAVVGTEPANDQSSDDRTDDARDTQANRSQLEAAESSDTDTSDVAFTREVELSASLSDAVADVELEFDGGARTRPPRKKRRRRGSRGGRVGAGTTEGGDTADGSAEESAEGSADVSDGGDHSEHSDAADGEASGEASSEGTEGEARVRRRGRRGRRGGSRRNRGAREEGENSSGGEDFSAPPPSAPAPED